MAAKASNISLESEIRIVIAGGGTGGHLYPALAIAEALKSLKPNVKVIFMGTVRGLEATIIPREGYQLFLLPVRGLLRRLTWQNLLFPIRLIWSIIRCFLFFRKFQPHLIIGTGGYVAGPALSAAKWSGIPRVIQEQNSYPGLVNRRHGNKVNAVFLTFQNSKEYFRRQNHLFVFGNPVRQNIAGFPKKKAYQELKLDEKRKTVLIFGGSQGAKRLNEIVAIALETMLAGNPIQFIWIVGPLWYEKWKSYEEKGKGKIRVFPFLNNMAAAYSITDLAICRAGASTIAELTLCGIPAIYVPLPHATADHQTMNARAVVDAGGGVLMPEKTLSPKDLASMVKKILGEEKLLRNMAGSARGLARPDAAEKIAKKCFEIITENRQGWG